MEITERLIRRIARQEFGQMAKSGAYTRGAGGGGSYTLPVAADGVLGGVQLGYPTSAANRYYAVQLDSSQRAYVNVPWTDHYAWGDITNKPSAAGDGTTPVYWTGSGFAQCTSYANARVAHADNAAAGDIPFMLNGATDNLPRICWHIPNTNWCNIAMDSGGSLHLTSTNVKSSTYNGLYVGDLQTYGALTLRANAYSGANPSYGLNCNNSDIININSIYTNDESDDWNEGIEFYRGDTGGWDSLRAYRGTWYFYSNNGSSYGNIQAQNGYAEGTWASKSDARMKNVVGDVDLTVEQIAAMPAVKFTWKNDPEKRVHVGTLAQPWQKVLPEAIETTQADTLMMCYGEAAMVSVIKLAQRVLELERMIKEK